jgi:hypothetical protein
VADQSFYPYGRQYQDDSERRGSSCRWDLGIKDGRIVGTDNQLPSLSPCRIRSQTESNLRETCSYQHRAAAMAFTLTMTTGITFMTAVIRAWRLRSPSCFKLRREAQAGLRSKLKKSQALEATKWI